MQNLDANCFLLKFTIKRVFNKRSLWLAVVSVQSERLDAKLWIRSFGSSNLELEVHFPKLNGFKRNLKAVPLVATGGHSKANYFNLKPVLSRPNFLMGITPSATLGDNRLVLLAKRRSSPDRLIKRLYN